MGKHSPTLANTCQHSGGYLTGPARERLARAVLSTKTRRNSRVQASGQVRQDERRRLQYLYLGEAGVRLTQTAAMKRSDILARTFGGLVFGRRRPPNRAARSLSWSEEVRHDVTELRQRGGSEADDDGDRARSSLLGFKGEAKPSKGLTCPRHFDSLTNVMGSATSTAAEGVCEVLVFNEDLVIRARDRILSDEDAQDIAELFKMLAHPTRVQILRALADQELCVCDLAEVLGLSVSATSYQLQLMRRLKLVRYRRDGKFAYYRVASDFVLALLRDCQFHLSQHERSGK